MRGMHLMRGSQYKPPRPRDRPPSLRPTRSHSPAELRFKGGTAFGAWRGSGHQFDAWIVPKGREHQHKGPPEPGDTKTNWIRGQGPDSLPWPEKRRSSRSCLSLHPSTPCRGVRPRQISAGSCRYRRCRFPQELMVAKPSLSDGFKKWSDFRGPVPLPPDFSSLTSNGLSSARTTSTGLKSSKITRPSGPMSRNRFNLFKQRLRPAAIDLHVLWLFEVIPKIIGPIRDHRYHGAALACRQAWISARP